MLTGTVAEHAVKLSPETDAYIWTVRYPASW